MLRPFDPRPSKANPESRATRKALEKEHGYENLKSMGLKAGVLAIMAGLALYPKISAEVDMIEREQRIKAEKKSTFRKKERARERGTDEDDRRRGHGGAGSERARSRGEREREDGQLVRVGEREVRRGGGYERRRRSTDDRRRGDDRRWEETSTRSAGSDRTRDWVEGGYEYLSGNDYRESDRRRW